MQYTKRLLELVFIAFLGSAVPALLAGELTKAGLSGAVAAGVAAAYGVVVKQIGDPTKPTIAK